MKQTTPSFSGPKVRRVLGCPDKEEARENRRALKSGNPKPLLRHERNRLYFRLFGRFLK